MSNFIIGLVFGIACAVVFGWVRNDSKKLEALRMENSNRQQELWNENAKLREIIGNQSLQKSQMRTLGQPARPVGQGSLRSRDDY